MSTPMTPQQASSVQRLLDGPTGGIPGLEVTELPPDEGWKQWDMAVRLHDINNFGDA